MAPSVHFEPSVGVIICHQYESGLVVNTPNSLYNHFCAALHHLRGPALSIARDLVMQWPAKRTSEVVHPGAKGVPVRAIPHLRVWSGWYCRHCTGDLSTNLAAAKRHLREQHNVRRGKEGRDLESCRLQTIFRDKKLVRWFRVLEPEKHNINADSSHHAPFAREDIDRFVHSQAGVFNTIEREEKLQAGRVQDGGDHKSEVIPWIRSCGFDRHLKNLDKKEIRRSGRKPEMHEPDAELLQKVANMAVRLLDETWEWCTDGPNCRLTRPMAVILSQFWTEATIHARGFRVGIGPDTKVRYFGLWANMVVYFARVSRGRPLPERAHQTTTPIRPGPKEISRAAVAAAVKPAVLMLTTTTLPTALTSLTPDDSCSRARWTREGPLTSAWQPPWRATMTTSKNRFAWPCVDEHGYDSARPSPLPIRLAGSVILRHAGCQSQLAGMETVW
jgi:hypothetical protein